MIYMRVIKHLLLFMLLSVAGKAMANGYAYIYIEGDKVTPFYVKLEGQMMPRLGMNYCILPNLDKGATKIEILFQQNKYPTQEFMVQVPESGSRGFVLERINDRQFALKDLHSGTYLVTGNKAEEDQLAAPAISESKPLEEDLVASKDKQEELPEFTIPKTNKASKAAAGSTAAGKDDRFLSDIEFNTQPVKQPAASNAEGAGVAASGCGTPMDNAVFETFALRIFGKEEDDAMLKELRRTKSRKCFTTEQVRILANSMKTQSGRFQVAEMMHAQTSDPEHYNRLEQLFNTNFLKQKFRENILAVKE